jgi:hypothetical protein
VEVVGTDLAAAREEEEIGIESKRRRPGRRGDLEMRAHPGERVEKKKRREELERADASRGRSLSCLLCYGSLFGPGLIALGFRSRSIFLFLQIYKNILCPLKFFKTILISLSKMAVPTQPRYGLPPSNDGRDRYIFKNRKTADSYILKKS